MHCSTVPKISVKVLNGCIVLQERKWRPSGGHRFFETTFLLTFVLRPYIFLVNDFYFLTLLSTLLFINAHPQNLYKKSLYVGAFAADIMLKLVLWPKRKKTGHLYSKPT